MTRSAGQHAPASLDTDFFFERRELIGKWADLLDDGKTVVRALEELADRCEESDPRFARALRIARDKMLPDGNMAPAFEGVLLPIEVEAIYRGEEAAELVPALRQIAAAARASTGRQVYLGRPLEPRKPHPLVAAWRRWRTAVYDRDGGYNRFIDGYMTAIDELEAAGKIPMMRYEERLERAFRAYENS